MKKNTILLALVVLFGAVIACSALDMTAGIWKLNEAKSNLAPGGGKNTMVVYQATGDTVKVTVDGVTAEGKPIHNEWTGKFDGKDYPITGDTSAGDTRSYIQANDHTLQLTVKKGGKVVQSGEIVFSPDGKSRTVSLKGTDEKGKPFATVAVYDRQ